MKNLAFSLIFTIGLISTSQEILAAGALAINGKQGAKYGWAADYPSTKLASERALKECGDGCNIVFTFTGGAAAYAADQSAGSTIYSWGRAASADKAKQIALEEIQKRGAKNPIIRAWAADSEKGNNIEFDDTKIKYYVQLKMRLENGKDTYKTGGWAQFVGWTYATKDELVKYGKKENYVWFSEDVTGAKKNGNFLLTSANDKIFGADFGYSSEPDLNPIMTRFVNKVVKNNSLYARRKVDEFSKDVAKLIIVNSANSFVYMGSIIAIDNNWNYDQLKKAGTHFEINNSGYAVVDAGEF